MAEGASVNRWDWEVSGYYSGNVAPPKERYALAIKTVHSCEMSRDMEVAAFMSRMNRGEIGRVEIVALKG